MNALFIRYKIPLLISLVVMLCILALNAESNPFSILFIILGALIGIFLLDLEYLLTAYVVDPDAQMSKQLKAEVVGKNIFSYARFLNDYEYEFKNLAMRSVVFHVLLLIFGYYIVITQSFVLAQAIVLSMLANILYFELMEILSKGNLDRWAWIYNGDVTKKVSFIYWSICLLFFLLLFIYV